MSWKRYDHHHHHHHIGVVVAVTCISIVLMRWCCCWASESTRQPTRWILQTKQKHIYIYTDIDKNVYRIYRFNRQPRFRRRARHACNENFFSIIFPLRAFLLPEYINIYIVYMERGGGGQGVGKQTTESCILYTTHKIIYLR